MGRSKEEEIREFLESHPHHARIFKKLLEIAGKEYDKFKFSKQMWFLDYMWTEEQEKAFKDWLFTYLKNEKYAIWELTESRRRTKSYIQKIVDEFVWNYGWKSKPLPVS